MAARDGVEGVIASHRGCGGGKDGRHPVCRGRRGRAGPGGVQALASASKASPGGGWGRGAAGRGRGGDALGWRSGRRDRGDVSSRSDRAARAPARLSIAGRQRWESAGSGGTGGHAGRRRGSPARRALPVELHVHSTASFFEEAVELRLAGSSPVVMPLERALSAVQVAWQPVREGGEAARRSARDMRA
eukprot:2268490-Pleurochrysis_carterae.AAC.2